MTTAVATRYAHTSRPLARLILVLWIGATALSIWSERSVYRNFSQPTSETGYGSADWSLYRAVARRLTDGETYYAALGTELKARGYPRATVFNWRTPAHLWIVSRPAGPILAPILLGLAGLACLVLAWRVLRRCVGRALSAIGALALFLALLPAACADVYLLSEVVAGTLIALSALLFADRRIRSGFLIALLAIFLREFALVFYSVAAAQRLGYAGRREVAAWVLGAVAWGIYFWIHAASVASVAGGPVSGEPTQWLGGGLSFVLATIEANALLGILPGWLVAAIAPTLLLGLASMPGTATRALRGAVFTYVGLFLFIGRPIHPYWGNLYAPLLSIGIALAIPTIHGLVKRARPDDAG